MMLLLLDDDDIVDEDNYRDDIHQYIISFLLLSFYIDRKSLI